MPLNPHWASVACSALGCVAGLWDKWPQGVCTRAWTLAGPGHRGWRRFTFAIVFWGMGEACVVCIYPMRCRRGRCQAHAPTDRPVRKERSILRPSGRAPSTARQCPRRGSGGGGRGSDRGVSRVDNVSCQHMHKLCFFHCLASRQGRFASGPFNHMMQFVFCWKIHLASAVAAPFLLFLRHAYVRCVAAQEHSMHASRSVHVCSPAWVAGARLNPHLGPRPMAAERACTARRWGWPGLVYGHN